MKIQLKRSNVLDGGQAKEPTSAQMEYGELAVNYSNVDPVLFLKDSSDNIIRIAGAGSAGEFDGDYNSLTNKPDLFDGDYNSLDNLPTIGDGTITVNQGGTEIAVFTVNQTGPTSVDLSEGAIYTAEAGKGIAINASNEISIGDDWSAIPALS